MTSGSGNARTGGRIKFIGTSRNIAPNSDIDPTNNYGTFSPFAFGSHGQAPLPVKFVSLVAIPQKGYNAIEWQTTSEMNVKHFEIEKSEDGSIFYPIGMIAAKNSSTLNAYSCSFLPISSIIFKYFAFFKKLLSFKDI